MVYIMKLRNKKTGAIYSIEDIDLGNNQDGIWLGMTRYNSLAELNEEWEDAPEEPKEYWYINTILNRVDSNYRNSRDVEDDKAIGNYFLSREEAEKAIEKLKAWKRLKDKGFRFVEGYLDNNDDFIIKAKLGHVGLIDQPDVSLLFGGEE